MIYTFYSYKGGVGRSMALANIAELFYQAGLKVLMVDWDLEAPGLERFFSVDEEEILDKIGVIDLLLDYKTKMSVQAHFMENEELPFLTPEKILVDLYPKANVTGKLYLITAGRRSIEHFEKYANAVLTFDWKDFYENWDGELYFEWLRKEFEKLADIVLIDSRTGVTEMGGVCTYQLADIVIMFCTPNDQSTDGTFKMAQKLVDNRIMELRNGRPLNLLIIPARVEKAESDLLDNFHREFIRLFSKYAPKKYHVDVQKLWQLGIPYIPKYSYKEILAVHESELASAEDLVISFKNIMDVMQQLRLYEQASTQPSKLAYELALSYSQLNYLEELNELSKISKTVDTVSEWLRDFPELVEYARGMSRISENDLNNAIRHFRDTFKDTQVINVAGVCLRIPGEFVITQDGKTIEVPLGSTPIDLAYHIHTDIGHRCRGAKINGKTVMLDYVLRTGDKVEVLTAKIGGPSLDWLNPNLGYIKTKKARNAIRKWFRKQTREQNISQGKALLENGLRRLGYPDINMEQLAHEFDFRNLDNLYEAIGCGDLYLGRLFNHVTLGRQGEFAISTHPSAEARKFADSAISVLGLKGLQTTMARCCNPAPGDDIVGYITRKRGATIHRQDCPLILRIQDRERLVRVSWGKVKRTYPVPVRIKAYDRKGLMKDITTLISDEGVDITDVNVDVNYNLALFELTLEVPDLAMLNRVLERLENLPNVLEAMLVHSASNV